MSVVVGLDAHSLIYRSYYAVSRFGAVQPYQVQRVLKNFIEGIVANIEPEYIFAAADSPGKTFRHGLCKSYKAGRATPEELREIIPQMIAFIEELGIPVYRADSYEADDILSSFTRRLDPDQTFTVVTSDKDLAALISQQVDLYLIRNQGHILYTHENGHDVFGIDPARICEFKALAGDSSDNITGVPGIGPKGALELLALYQCPDQLLDACDVLLPKYARRITGNEELLRLSYQLASLCYEAPCEIDMVKAMWGQDKLQTLRARSVRGADPVAAAGYEQTSLFSGLDD